MTDKPDKKLESAMLNNETGVIAWEELAKHFARGVVIRIAAELDLVEAGQAVLNDNAAVVEKWQAADQLRRASDSDARRWNEENTEFWAMVIAPWVIVQEIDASKARNSLTDDKKLH